MSLTPAERLEQEAAWVDPAFASLDLSAYPSLAPAPPETSRDDGKFARDWRDTALSASSAELRRFVNDPDIEALTRVGEETGEPGLLRDVRDRHGERTAVEFKARCPDYLPTDQNFEAMVATLAYNALNTAEQN